VKSFVAGAAMCGVVVAFAPGAANADDDRPPTSDELARIEATLRGAGFTRWEEIEFDDGAWEVDDARGPDGAEYDLKIHAVTFAIIERDRDD